MVMDNELLNEDWLKTRTWDIYRLGTLVTTLPDFFWCLGVVNASPAEQRKAVQHATELPSWVPAPKELKDAVADFLKPKTTNLHQR
jgi:hypothetical protein